MRNAFTDVCFFTRWILTRHISCCWSEPFFFFSLPFKVSRMYTCVWVSKCVCRVYISITSIYNTSDCIRCIYKHTYVIYGTYVHTHYSLHTFSTLMWISKRFCGIIIHGVLYVSYALFSVKLFAVVVVVVVATSLFRISFGSLFLSVYS